MTLKIQQSLLLILILICPPQTVQDLFRTLTQKAKTSPNMEDEDEFTG